MFQNTGKQFLAGIGSVDGAVRRFILNKFIRSSANNQFLIPRATPDYFRGLPIFSREIYFQLNPDLPLDIDPYWHVSSYGVYEVRRMFSSEGVQAALASVEIGGEAENPPAQAQMLTGTRFIVLVSALGNFFMRELAERLVGDLRRAGADVELADETCRAQSLRGRTTVVVAPHEFFLLGKGGQYWHQRLGQFEFYVLNTEQPQTQWFSQCFRYLLLANGILDLSPHTAEVFRKSGLNACAYVPAADHKSTAYTAFSPAEHPLLKGYPDLLQVEREGDVLSAPRPIDISFVGGPSARRELFFAESAPFLSHWRCVIDYRKHLNAPILWDHKNQHELGFGHFLARHSKIYLNVHREDFGFFEIHRMVMQGMANGAAVVTDGCLPHPDFVAGTDYLQEALSNIPSLLEWLLTSPEGQEKLMQVSKAGHEAYKQKCSPDRASAVLSRFFAARAA